MCNCHESAGLSAPPSNSRGIDRSPQKKEMRDPLRDRAINVRCVQRCYRTPWKSQIGIGGRVCGSAWDNIVRSSSSCAAPAIRRTRCSAHRAGLVLHRTLPHTPPVGISPYVNVASAPVWAKKTLRRLLHDSATSRQGCSWRKVAAVSRFQCRTLQRQEFP